MSKNPILQRAGLAFIVALGAVSGAQAARLRGQLVISIAAGKTVGRPGVRVKLSGEGKLTGVSRTALSTSGGYYFFRNLRPGDYTLSVEGHKRHIHIDADGRTLQNAQPMVWQ